MAVSHEDSGRNPTDTRPVDDVGNLRFTSTSPPHPLFRVFAPFSLSTSCVAWVRLAA